MNLTVTKTKRGSAAAQPAHKKLAPLSAINTHEAAAMRSTSRVTDIPGRRPTKPITFDSAL